MTVKELAEKVKGRVLVDAEGNATSFYAGDFLSRVMGNAPSNSAWFTVMTNVNVAGVAVLAEIRIIVLCEGAAPSDELVSKCREQEIGLIATELPLFESCVGVV